MRRRIIGFIILALGILTVSQRRELRMGEHVTTDVTSTHTPLTPDQQHTLAIQFYNAARAEIVQRLAMREQGLYAFVAAVGIIIGVALKDSTNNHVLGR